MKSNYLCLAHVILFFSLYEYTQAVNGIFVTYSVYLFLWQVKWNIFHHCQECSVAASLLNFLNLLFVPAIIDNRIAGRDYRYDDAIQVSSFYLPSNTVVFEKLVLPF